MQPTITVFCPMTRFDYLDRWFDDLYSTDLDPECTNLVFLVDIDREEGGAWIRAKIMEEMNKLTWKNFIIISNDDHHVNEVNIPIRRRRIAEIHEQSKQAIKSMDSEYILGLEDDTVFTNLSVQRMLGQFQVNDGIGLVSAYEAGRWSAKMIGIWQFNRIDNPTRCWTMLPGKNFEDIDAAGMYCYLTPTRLYLEHTYSTEDWQPWGPDVNYGLWLRQQGYTNLVDWSQPCGHRDEDIIITPNGNLHVEQFFLDENSPLSNSWMRVR